MEHWSHLYFGFRILDLMFDPIAGHQLFAVSIRNPNSKIQNQGNSSTPTLQVIFRTCSSSPVFRPKLKFLIKIPADARFAGCIRRIISAWTTTSASSLFRFSESKRASRLLCAIAVNAALMSSDRTSPDSNRKTLGRADIVGKHWIRISNTARTVGSEYKTNRCQCSGVNLRRQVSGVSKQMTEDREQKSDKTLFSPFFIICLLSSELFLLLPNL